MDHIAKGLAICKAGFQEEEDAGQGAARDLEALWGAWLVAQQKNMARECGEKDEGGDSGNTTIMNHSV